MALAMNMGIFFRPGVGKDTATTVGASLSVKRSLFWTMLGLAAGAVLAWLFWAPSSPFHSLVQNDQHQHQIMGRVSPHGI
jgi:hypothetical protein